MEATTNPVQAYNIGVPFSDTLVKADPTCARQRGCLLSIGQVLTSSALSAVVVASQVSSETYASALKISSVTSR